MKKKRTVLKLVISIMLLSIVGLTAYHMFYKSPRVDEGVMKLSGMANHHEHVVTSVRFLPGDSLVASSSADSTVKIWRRESRDIVHNIKQPSGVSYMDISQDGMYVATGGYDSKLRLWQISDGTLLKTFDGHKGTIWCVDFSNDGKYIASSGDDAVIRIWEVATGMLMHELKAHNRIVWSVKFSPDGNQLASASFDFTFKVWNVGDGKLIWNNTEHKETIVDLEFSHKGTMLATTSDDRTIKLWDLASKNLLRTMEVPEHVQAVAFSADDSRLMTGGRDKTMLGEFLQSLFGDSKFNPGVSARLWDIRTGKLLHTVTDHYNDVQDLDYSSDNQWVVTGSADKRVGVWKITK